MSFKDFTLEDLKIKFGTSNKVKQLFDDIKPLEPSELLSLILKENLKIPLRTEKAKSEFIVAPILTELKRRNNDFFTLYSGEVLNADKKTGLFGECDFIISKNTDTFDMNCPIFSVVEAKKNDIDIGIPQCCAQMVGIQVFNKRHLENIDTIYGCVTTVDEWKFLKLKDNNIIIDSNVYYFNKLEDILGVFQFIIDFYKT